MRCGILPPLFLKAMGTNIPPEKKKLDLSRAFKTVRSSPRVAPTSPPRPGFYRGWVIQRIILGIQIRHLLAKIIDKNIVDYSSTPLMYLLVR